MQRDMLVQPTRRRSLAGDRAGVAAIEFAILLPLLLLLYFGAFETARAVETHRKLASVASVIGDLIAQQNRVTTADIDAIMEISTSILQPYARSMPTVTITAIKIGEVAERGKIVHKAEIVWSRRFVEGRVDGTASGTLTTVPEQLSVSGTFLIRAEASLDYRPVLLFLAENETSRKLFGLFRQIPMSETYYLRPRQRTAIPCSDC